MNGQWLLITCMSLYPVVWTLAADTTEPNKPGEEDVEPPKTGESTKENGKEQQPRASQNTREDKVAELAAKYHVPPKEVQQLRDRGLGWGEIRHALSIAQRSGKSLSDVMQLRESGMGWGQIARKYGFRLGEVTGKAVEREHKREDREDRMERRAATATEGSRGRGYGVPHGDSGRFRTEQGHEHGKPRR